MKLFLARIKLSDTRLQFLLTFFYFLSKLLRMHRSIAFSWKRLNFSIFNAANFFFVRRAMTTQVDQLAEVSSYSI
jgi:hypothetical protein